MATKNSLETFKELLISDLTKYSENICKILAQDVADILTNETKNAISDFYSYAPKYYLRHDNFNYSFRRDYKNRSPRFYGGVELLMDSLPDVYKGTNSDPNSVFWRVYSGYHGIASFQGRAPIMNPAPITRILNKRTEIVHNQNKYIDLAENKARQQKYNILFQ